MGISSTFDCPVKEKINAHTGNPVSDTSVDHIRPSSVLAVKSISSPSRPLPSVIPKWKAGLKVGARVSKKAKAAVFDSGDFDPSSQYSHQINTYKQIAALVGLPPPIISVFLEFGLK